MLIHSHKETGLSGLPLLLVAAIGILASCVTCAFAQPLELVTGRIRVNTGRPFEVSGTPLAHPSYPDYFPERHVFSQVGSDDQPTRSALGRISVETDPLSGKGLRIDTMSQATPSWPSAALVEAQFEVLPVWRLRSPPPEAISVPVILQITGSYTIEDHPECQFDCASTTASISLSDQLRGEVVDEHWELDTESAPPETLDIDRMLHVDVGAMSETSVMLHAALEAKAGLADGSLSAMLKIDPDATFLHEGTATPFHEAFVLRFSPEIAVIPIPEPGTLSLFGVCLAGFFGAWFRRGIG